MKRIEYDKSRIVDLTNYDFSNAPIYKSKPISYQAYKLKEAETITRSWGIQEMKKGDWIILKPSSNGQLKKSGIKKEAFQATYKNDPKKNGYFFKESFIKAVKIDHPFTFVGIDSNTPENAPAGSYLVLNLDKRKNPIMVKGKKDIFFYTEKDLQDRYFLL